MTKAAPAAESSDEDNIEYSFESSPPRMAESEFFEDDLSNDQSASNDGSHVSDNELSYFQKAVDSANIDVEVKAFARFIRVEVYKNRNRLVSGHDANCRITHLSVLHACPFGQF